MTAVIRFPQPRQPEPEPPIYVGDEGVLVLPPSPEHPFGCVTEEGLRDIGRAAFGIEYREP